MLFTQAFKLAAAGLFQTKVTLSSEVRKEGVFICNKAQEPYCFILQNPQIH